ncbi:MAG: TolB family protein [Paludibacteraceae bacterium]
MKKILLLLLCTAQLSIAQQVNVLFCEKIKDTANGGYFYPKFSPDKSYILLTGANYSGLVKYSLDNEHLSILSNDPGAGYDVQISDDGTTILYKKIEIIKKLRFNSLITQDLNTNKRTTIVKSTRENIAGRLIHSKPIYVKGAKMIKNLPISPNFSQDIVTVENQKIVLYQNGIRKELTPNGNDKSYIWPSISPDGQRLLYTAIGNGTFVSNIDGTEITPLGKLNAPKWAGNSYVIGMDDIDYGGKLLSSTLIICSADGKLRETINTPDNVQAMYPAVSKNGDKIAFNTENGEVYLMNIELK